MPDGKLGHHRSDRRVESRTPIPPGERISFALVLRYPVASQAAIEHEGKQLLAGVQPALSRDVAASVRAADPADVERVRAFAARAGLSINAVDPRTRVVQVSGDARTVNSLLGITL